MSLFRVINEGWDPSPAMETTAIQQSFSNAVALSALLENLIRAIICLPKDTEQSLDMREW